MVSSKKLSLKKLMKNKLINNKQIIRFIIAGVTTVAVEVSSFIVLTDIFRIHYLSANLLSIGLAILINYIFSKKWVFEDGKHSNKIELLLFLSLSLFGLIINQSVMWILVDNFSFNQKVSKLVAICMITVISFLTKKLIIFKS